MGANEFGWKQMSKRLVIFMLALFLVGCNKREQLQHYQLEGVVVSVEANVHEVTVNHKAIPGFMEAMTMPYVVKDEAALEKLGPGDEITADLVVNCESFRAWLEHVQIRKAASGAEPPSPARTSLPALGQLIPSFRLVNQDARTVRSSDFRTQALLVTFVYTRCPFPDMCPRLNRNFEQLAAALERDRDQYPPTHLLSVSLDPEFDRPTVLREYAQRFGKRSADWDFVTGSPDEIKRMADFFGVGYWKEQGTITHSMITALVSPDGKLAHIYYGNDWEIATVLNDVRAVKNQR